MHVGGAFILPLATELLEAAPDPEALGMVLSSAPRARTGVLSGGQDSGAPARSGNLLRAAVRDGSFAGVTPSPLPTSPLLFL